MRYTVTFLEQDFAALQNFLFQDHDVERATILRCRTSTTADEVRFLVRAVHRFEGDDLYFATDQNVSIKSTAFMSVLKVADRKREAIILVHSHPRGEAKFSPQDDRTEPPFFRAAFSRIELAQAHGSLVFAGPASFAGRVWLPDGSTQPLNLLRVIGDRWRFLSATADTEPIPEFFDRQIRAFGPDMQRILRRLHVGIVGAGGTGSPTIEQLTRLGVGTLTVFDNQTFEGSNVNRVYNARVADEGMPKVDIAQRAVDEIGLGTNFRRVNVRITNEAAAKLLRKCDVIFGCSDDHLGRAILNALAIRYYIPVIDVGVKISSLDSEVKKVTGRITTLLPGSACLHCRGRIDPALMRLEALHPDELARLRGLGYVSELADPAPAVVSFTSSVASSALNEFLQRLTGYMGEGAAPGEILHHFEDRRIARTSVTPRADCDCQNQAVWGAGDTNLFLDMTWPDEVSDPLDAVVVDPEVRAA